MSGTFDRDMRRACEPFERDHDRLRAKLMASLPAEAPEAPRLDASPRRRLWTGLSPMKRRILRIGIPAAVAAAVLLAVGLWPESGRKGAPGGSGRVYGMTDVAQLLTSARIIHMKGWQFLPQFVSPGQEQTKEPLEAWCDVPGGRRHSWFARQSTVNDQMTVVRAETVLDGEYEMEVDHAQKTVQFARLTPFQRTLESQKDFDALFKRMFGDPQRLSSFKPLGHEEIDGRAFAVWEGEFAEDLLPLFMRCRCWLDPVSGNIGRVHVWMKQKAAAADWSPSMQMETIERLEDAPAGTFVTDPATGYTLVNEKTSAPYRELCFEGGVGLGDLSYKGLIAFVLEDGSLVLGWSSTDKKAVMPQSDLFKDLSWGGPLPKLPIEIHGLEQQVDSQKITYTGRHLTYTRKADRFVEWSLYVPDRTPPAGSLSRYYRALHRFNVPKSRVQGTMATGVGQPFNVVPDSFDTLVLGAMAELSDSGVTPADVTYERVMQLSQQIRGSLGKP